MAKACGDKEPWVCNRVRNNAHAIVHAIDTGQCTMSCTVWITIHVHCSIYIYIYIMTLGNWGVTSTPLASYSLIRAIAFWLGHSEAISPNPWHL